MDLSNIKETQKENNSRNRSWKPRSQGSNGQKLQEQRPNHRSQQKKMFERTLQQQQWFKKGAYINCKKQSHFTKDCQKGQSTSAIKKND